jgi:hypothetical protein
MNINLVPSAVSFYVTQLTYKIEELHVNNSCKIVAYLCESNGNRIKRYDLWMSGEEYNNWGEDDMYLVDWLCNKCGVVRQGKEVVDVVEETVPVVIDYGIIEESTPAPEESTPAPEESTPAPEETTPAPEETM